MMLRIASLSAVLLLAACAEQSATPVATQPSPTAIPEATTPEGFEALKQMLDRGTPDEKRRAIASLTVAQCFLKNTAENTFRGVAEGSDGLEKRTTTTDGVDVYVDEEVGMMMGLSDELCHVMIAGSDVAAVADIVEPSLGFGGGGEQTYQSTDDGFGVRFIGDGGQKFLSVVRADTIPGSDNTPSVSVFVFKES